MFNCVFFRPRRPHEFYITRLHLAHNSSNSWLSFFFHSLWTQLFLLILPTHHVPSLAFPPQWSNVHEQPKRGGLHRRHLLPCARRRHQRGECCPLLVKYEPARVHEPWLDLSLQYGSVGPMAITLSQSLGQNIGMLRNKDRIDAGETQRGGNVSSQSHSDDVMWCYVEHET